MKPNLLFLTLKVFSETGGIEKVSQLAGKALGELCAEVGFDFRLYSAYDKLTEVDERYVSKALFSGFAGNKRFFALQGLRRGRTATVVLLSHINLLPLGYAIKKASPRTKLVLLAHGIEVWQPLSVWKKHMLNACDLVLPVSQFTKEKMLALHGLNETKLRVVNNCLDPFLPPLASREKSNALLQRYRLTAANKILLTLTRLSFKERYKGYDEVLMALKSLKKEEPNLRYLMVGKYDEKEKARLDRLVQQQGLQNEVIVTGFVANEELAAHFNLADVYVMPSRKEGFGIVFIEALFYGKPVIAGNVDGSVDALANGELGVLVNPDNPSEIRNALRRVLIGEKEKLPSRKKVMERFGFGVYKKALWQELQGFFYTKEMRKSTIVRKILRKKPLPL